MAVPGKCINEKTITPASDAPLIVKPGSDIDTLAKAKEAQKVLYANDSFSTERKK